MSGKKETQSQKAARGRGYGFRSNYGAPGAANVNCPACDGSGWTVEGWNARAHDADPFKGDCATCAGTGAVEPIVISIKVRP